MKKKKTSIWRQFEVNRFEPVRKYMKPYDTPPPQIRLSGEHMREPVADTTY